MRDFVGFHAQATLFTGDNGLELLARYSGQLTLVEKHIGPGNTELWIEHLEIPERLQIGHWVVELGDSLVFLPDRTYRLLCKWTIKRPSRL